MPKKREKLIGAMALSCCLVTFACKSAHAQPEQQQQNIINLAGQTNLDLSALVRLLAAEENLQIFFDEDQFPTTSPILFFGDVRVRQGEEFFHFVQTVLRNRGFAIVKSDIEGVHRIVPLTNVRPFVPQRNAAEGQLDQGLQKGQYVTAIFSLTHITSDQADQYLRQFVLTDVARDRNQPNDTITKISSSMLIVTEMASRIEKIRNAITSIDVLQAQIQTIFVKVEHLEAKKLEEQLNAILDQQQSAQDQTGDQNNQPSRVFGDATNVRISSDERTNRLILIGTSSSIDRVRALIEKLDQELELNVQTFAFQHISAKRVDDILRRSLGADDPSISQIYQSTVDEDANVLIVTAREDILKRIQQIKTQLDKAESAAKTKSPIAFYKLKHVKASAILDTLQRVSRDSRPDLFEQQQQNDRLRGFNTRSGFNPAGPNLPDPNIEGVLTAPPFVTQDSLARSGAGGRISDALQQSAFDSPLVGDIARLVEQIEQADSIVPGDAKITVDENTNTLIVVAEPAIQQLYQQLIEKLDVYRAQVLIEVSVVVLDCQDDLNFGIEISGGDRSGAKRLFAFTSWGLSDVDPITGALTIIPGLGFNGTLVDPDTADVVLRALTRHRRARVLSAPKVLVNDNATGLLSSVAEVPFSSVNASNTVATTSFAGFAQAGTTISVTPQISEGDYLNLEFDVLVNDFTGTGNETLPPPRNTDQVTSQVTIPDGHTVIVGGLTRERSSFEVQGLPIIENIPGLNVLTSSQSKGSRTQRLFVFIKPIILKDDKFKDLRYLSDLDRRTAGVPGEFPESRPLLVK